jgi:hypothetical protein
MHDFGHSSVCRSHIFVQRHCNSALFRWPIWHKNCLHCQPVCVWISRCKHRSRKAIEVKEGIPNEWKFCA